MTSETTTENTVYSTIFDVIETRSFSSVWFWISLAVFWGFASHWIIGIPYDVILRARKHGGIAQVELEQMVVINVQRILGLGRRSGLLLLSLICFLLTSLSILGFVYTIEFAQALFFLGLPSALIVGLNVSLARLIYEDETQGEALCQRLTRHRLIIQALGVLCIAVTAMWGVTQNLT